MSQPSLGDNERASLPQVRHDRLRHLQVHLINVTPGPSLAGLEGGHHGMGLLLEVFRGVAVRRAVATADMTASQAETEMHPGRSHFQTFFTPLSASGNGLKSSHVWTGHNVPPRLKSNRADVEHRYTCP